ncbi:hypothetical protein BHE74_00031017, partial [Ensete ventricosum]
VLIPTLRVKKFEKNSSGQGLQENLDLLKEWRVEVHLWTLAYHRVVARLYNCSVRHDRLGMVTWSSRKSRSVTQRTLEAS